MSKRGRTQVYGDISIWSVANWGWTDCLKAFKFIKNNKTKTFLNHSDVLDKGPIISQLRYCRSLFFKKLCLKPDIMAIHL